MGVDDVLESCIWLIRLIGLISLIGSMIVVCVIIISFTLR